MLQCLSGQRGMGQRRGHDVQHIHFAQQGLDGRIGRYPELLLQGRALLRMGVMEADHVPLRQLGQLLEMDPAQMTTSKDSYTDRFGHSLPVAFRSVTTFSTRPRM